MAQDAFSVVAQGIEGCYHSTTPQPTGPQDGGGMLRAAAAAVEVAMAVMAAVWRQTGGGVEYVISEYRDLLLFCFA